MRKTRQKTRHPESSYNEHSAKPNLSQFFVFFSRQSMQIKNIKISNILNYCYVKNLNQVDGISFRTKEKGVTNIVIGPNGAGKSNLLEIINQVIKTGLQQDYYYDNKLNHKLQQAMQKEQTQKKYTNLKKREKKTKQIIKQAPSRTHNLKKHKNFTSKRAKVVMTILLHKGDYDNMRFILKYRKQINSLIRRYSSTDVRFHHVDKHLLLMENTITLYFSFQPRRRTFSLRQRNLSEIQKFIIYYLKHKELIQICMHLYNKYEKPSHQTGRYSLKNTFALLGANRSYGKIKNKTHLPDLSAYQLNKIIAEQDTKHQGDWPLGYYLCKKKIKELSYYKGGYDQQFIRDINKVLHKYFQVELIVTTNIKNKHIHFTFLHEDGHVYHIDELNSGLQSIIFMILAMFGHDLQYGLCIIDEPELHLHPQLQKTLIRALQYMQTSFRIQYILATHSPLFIDEKNIYNVVRISQSKKGVMIKNPGGNISNNEANMIHMLKYEYMTKIFFVPKIIMVEGETDAYFFEQYIEWLEHTHNRNIHEHEILTIDGKGSFKKRKKFLNKFGIESYYIGDRDNILDTVTIPSLKHYKRIVYSHKPEYSQYNPSYKTQFYEKLIQVLHDLDHKTYKKCIQMIDKYYQNNIFLLRKGDLETYLGMREKGLEETVRFCTRHFQTWLQNEHFQSHRKEINHILSIILDEKQEEYFHEEKQHQTNNISKH